MRLNIRLCGAAICFMAGAVPLYPAAADAVLPRSCVTRDLAIVTLIEKLGEAQATQPAVLANAFIEVLDARRVCSAGVTHGALEIYDRVGARLTGADRWTALHSDP